MTAVLTTLVNFNGTNGFYPNTSLIANARGELLGGLVAGTSAMPCGRAICTAGSRANRSGRSTAIRPPSVPGAAGPSPDTKSRQSRS